MYFMQSPCKSTTWFRLEWLLFNKYYAPHTHPVGGNQKVTETHDVSRNWAAKF